MAFTDDQASRVLAAINKNVENRTIVCAVCGHNTWGIQNQGLVYLNIQENPAGGLVLGGPSLPNVAIICSTCGNTHLLNIFNLGVADAFGIKSGEQLKQEAAEAGQPEPQGAEKK